MRSKRSREGYLQIDNRLSGGQNLELPVITCSHCHTQVILNPDRSRAREYCAKCDHYICDGCAAARRGVDECRPLSAVIDALQESALRNSVSGDR
jgi:hypothetical protein